MTRATLGRWGKSLAVRFPAEVAKATGFGEGQKIEIIGRRGESSSVRHLRARWRRCSPAGARKSGANSMRGPPYGART